MTDLNELLSRIGQRVGDSYRLRFNSWVERGERTFFVDINGVAFGHNREVGEAFEDALAHYSRQGSPALAKDVVMLVSIMHTGTTFLKGLVNPHMFRHIHEQECLTQAEGADWIVVPLRHPAKVWRSFKWRGRSEAVFWLSWALLDWYDRRYRGKVLYVPVDREGVRDRHLQEVSEKIGVPLETDWAPRNRWPRERVKIEVPDLGPVFEYEVVRRFYGLDFTETA